MVKLLIGEKGTGKTKKLIDFVNKSGTIHYGRYVAGMIEKER